MRRTLVCVACGTRIESTAGAARKLGWALWDGGGRCPKCENAREAAEVRAIPAPVDRQRADVECSSCGKRSTGTEIEPGVFWPTIHWLTTDANKRRLREEKHPIPMCPGSRLPGRLVAEGASA